MAKLDISSANAHRHRTKELIIISQLSAAKIKEKERKESMASTITTVRIVKGTVIGMIGIRHQEKLLEREL